jgi:O-antigen/teichoic acid export membrane protein
VNILKNYFFSLSLQVMNILTPLITLPLVVRALGNDGMGRIAIASSILSYFMILGSSGLNSYGNKVIAKQNTPKDLNISFNHVFSLQVLYTTVSVLSFLIYILFFEFKLREILMISLFQLLASYFDFTWFFYGINEIKTIAIRNVLIKFIGIVLIYFFVKTAKDIYNYFWILGGASLLANLSVLLIINKKIDFKSIKLRFRVKKAELISSLYIIFPLLLMALYSNIDRFIILGYLKTFDSVGIYDVGMKFISIFAVLIISLRPLMISKISKNSNDINKIEELVHRSISLVFYISIPICILLFANIGSFISLFLGSKFIESAIIIKILAIQILLTGIGDVFVNQILISIGQEKKILLIMSVLCSLLVVLYIIMIPVFGIYGAAISSVFAHFLILFLEFYYVNRYIKVRVNIIEILKCLLAGFICTLFLSAVYNILLINTYTGLIILTAFGIIIYVIACFILNFKFQNKIIGLVMASIKNK